MLEGILAVLSIKTFLLILGSVTAGLLLGAIPGITVTMGVALFLPLTYGMTPLDGLSVLMGLYMGGTTGGLIAAVLLNIPGNPACVATTFDGYPMAKRGEGGRALGLGIIGSFIGGIFSIIVLILVAPRLARVALEFGPYEYFSIAFFSLTMIATLSGKSLTKGLISASFGVVAALVGMAPISAFSRFTFDSPNLLMGFSLLPALVGLFAFSQILEMALLPKEKEDSSIFAYKLVGLGVSLSDLKKQTGNFFRSSVLGTVIGVLPGVGGAIINIVAYALEKKLSKFPEKFGTGIDDGIVASETSNNACTGGALVPTLTLGIPGDNTTAVILAGFMIHGISPGPLLFTEHPVLVYGIFASLLVANIVMFGLSYWTLRACVKLLSVPKNILLPVVGAMCVIGSYGLDNSFFDIWTMVIFGIMGFVLLRFQFPLAPLILGFILGPIIETNLRRGLQRSDGDLTPFLTEPISGAFLLITAIIVGFTVYSGLKQKKAKAA